MKKILVAAVLVLVSGLLLCADAAGREARLVILPFQVHAKEDLGYIQSGIGSLLPARISLPGKIAVMDPGAVRQALTKKSAGYTLEETVALARALGAEYVLTGSLTKIGETISIDALVVDVAAPGQTTSASVQSQGFDALIPELQVLARQVQRRILEGPAPPAPAPAEIPAARAPAAAPPPPAPGRAEEPIAAMPAPPREAARPAPTPPFIPARPAFSPEPTAEHVLTHPPFICLAAGDTTGGGRAQLLIADNSFVQVYEVNGSGLEHKASIPTKTGELIVHIELFDLNGNGREELYVSSHSGQGANSFVVEYADGAYRRIAESQPWFFHSYAVPGSDAALLGLAPGSENSFAGVAHRLAWKGDELAQGEELPLPSGVSPFGSAWGDITGDGRLEYISFARVFLSARYHLKMFSPTGRVKWSDPHDLGGSANSFVRFKVGSSLEQTEYIPLRVYCEDFGRGAPPVIIVARNSKNGRSFLRRLAAYNQGEMVCLHWDGADLVPGWSSGPMEGYISDYLLADIDGDGKKELIVLSVAGPGFFGKARNSVRIFTQAR